ncbi:MAG: helix-turn-helix transcriptional regulator [Bacteroidetes bacterium]|nr:helix-turn-helix transcriptional regulator [Bacteroidota bacterium]
MPKSSHIYIDADLLKLIARIKWIRRQLGYSQEKLAYEMNRDKSSIQRLERGVVNPGFLYVRDIAKALGVPLRILMDIN